MKMFLYLSRNLISCTNENYTNISNNIILKTEENKTALFDYFNRTLISKIEKQTFKEAI